MVKICLTGGPCGGKSTSLAKIEQVLLERGYKVLIVPETATELITGGITPSGLSFQKKVYNLQLAKERIYETTALEYGTDNTIILYDRGIMDQLAYMSKEDLVNISKEYGYTISDLMARYDAVYHLETAAKNTDCYTLGNNQARYETAEEAIEKDNKTIAAWTGHPHLRIIDNSTGFEEKIQRLISDILHFLGEPEPMEIERKFLIKRPSENVLNNISYICKTNIIQTYLKSTNENVERRIRQRGTESDGYTFYYTEKTAVSFGKRIENERKISERQYIDMLMETDTSKHSIKKERYCFIHDNQYFELDIYPFSDEYAILEVELNDINSTINLPEYLTVIKEVTGDSRYSNYELSKNFTLKLED